MKKIKLVNLSLFQNDSPSFTVGNYEFFIQVANRQQGLNIYTPNMASRDNRTHKQNAYVQFNHSQNDSILFSGGRVGTSAHLTHKRKFIEDILLLGSLLTKNNWAMYSRRYTAGYPLIPANHLRTISTGYVELQQDLSTLILKLKESAWQQQFDNGFHLKMLLNNSNNYNSDSRFLSQVIIWEFLYAKLFGGESRNLQEIMKRILEHFWGNQVNSSIFLTGNVNRLSKNIFHVLRNQLAHSGKLPIDRPYAEQWMRQLPWEAPYGSMARGLKEYLIFFNELTQVIVMKTMDFHPETRSIFNTFNFTENLNRFLSTGKI